MIPTTHHGRWSGENRLWLDGPGAPARCQAAMTCTADGVDIRWSHADKEHSGSLRLHGQPAALRLAFQDSFHAATEMSLHGTHESGLVVARGTYEAGPGHPEWGWIIELDWRDPDALVLRMFNVVPGEGPVLAVLLTATRAE